MTLEQALLAALGAVVSALVWVAKILWKRSEACETDRRELRKDIEKFIGENGEAKGALSLYKRCRQEECPFKPEGEHVSRYGPPGLSHTAQ